MRTSKYIKLHTRCITVCELIQQADEVLSRTEAFVAKEKKQPWMMQNDFALKRCEYDIKKYTAIRERLVRWYSDMFERLQSETSEFRTPNWLKGIGDNPLSPYTTELNPDEIEEETLRILTGK